MLQDARSLALFMEQTGESLPNTSTAEYLSQLLKAYSLTRHEVIEQAGLERSTGYQIFAGQRNPKRDALLRIALVMKLTPAETQRLLKIAQRGELYPKNRRDAAILYCVQHRIGLIEAEILLEEINEPLLR